MRFYLKILSIFSTVYKLTLEGNTNKTDNWVTGIFNICNETVEARTRASMATTPERGLEIKTIKSPNNSP